MPHLLRVVEFGGAQFVFSEADMADTAQHNLQNHSRFDPLFHFFIIPVVVITLINAIVQSVRNPGVVSAWTVVFVAAILAAVFKIRLYALKVQDRVIRLEERLRLAALVSVQLRSRIDELSEGQLIALRFASDGELPALFERALNQKLGKTDIKKSVANWRGDYFRV